MAVASPAQGDPVELADASILLSNSNCNYLSLGPQGPSSPDVNVSMFAIVRRFTNSGSGSYVLSTGGPGCYRYAMGQSSSTRQLTFWLDSVTALDSGIAVEDNAWIAVAIAYDATAHRATFFCQRLTGPDGVTYQPSSYPLQTQTVTTASSPVTGGDEARIGHGSSAASTYMWDGGIAAPCLWHNYLVTAADFQGLLPGMSDVGRIPPELGLPGDLQFWFAFSGRSVNEWADNAVAITDASGRLLTATACRSSTGRYPFFDLPPWLPISFSAPRTSASRPVPRSWPFPYSAAFAIAHDNHSLVNREEYIRLLRWFNTDQTDPVHGAGLDMETTFSIWAFVCKGYRSSWGQENAFSYYKPLDRFSPVLEEKTPDAAIIRQLIYDGLIDSLHGYGDFGSTSDYRPAFRPEYASAFIADLARHGLSLPPVWMNHGDGENTHNVGPATIQAGDNGGTTPAPEYHWHLTRQAGSGIWSWFAGNPSGLNPAYLFAVPDWSESRNPPCKPYTYDDGQRGYVFPRFAARILYRVADDGLAAVMPGTYATLTVSDAAMPGYAWSGADSVLIWSSSTNEVGHACLADAKHAGGVWTLTLGPQNQFRITQSAQNVRFYVIRCGYNSASCFWDMADYFDERILDNLEARGALAIAYAHLEYYTYDPSMESYIGFTPARLAASYAGFRRLADRHHSGHIFVAGLSRMLRYSLVRNQVTYRLTQPRPNIYRVTIDPTFKDSVLGVVSLTSEACMGLTFYRPTGLGLEVYLGDQPLNITQNPPDATGAASCTVKWVRLHSSLLEEDECPDDPDKTEPGVCGCGVSDADTDGDGTPDCVDECPADPAKVASGQCGCGVSEVDTDGDGTPDCVDECPADPAKVAPGRCGCDVSEVDTDGDGTPDCVDECPADPAKVAPGRCGCDVSDLDTDGDGTPDCADECPADPAKVAPGRCGCDVSDLDTDGDGTPDCVDECPADPAKVAPGQCGCGVSEVDTDGDGAPDCVDECPADPAKVAPGQCGCGVPDVDTDGDGTPDCVDECPADPAKVAPGQCGCGVPDVDTDGDGTPDCGVSEVDTDGDGTPDCADECPADPAKVAPGLCGCGVSEVDTDGDATPDCADECPADPAKVAPGLCGCGVSDVDTDGDATPDCADECPADPAKVAPGLCGCGVSDVDTDGDGTPDCADECPADPAKVAPGLCGCGVSDVDTDGDGTPDCADECPADPAKVAPGLCGCGVSDVDTDGDGTPDCADECPADPAKVASGQCGCGVSDVDTDGDGTPDCVDECPADPAKVASGQCGCGVSEVDTDGDGTPDCADECPADPAKVAPGQCGCDVSEADTDGDGTPDCVDECPADPAKVAPGLCGCGVSEVDTDGDGTPDCADECPADPAKVAPGQCGCDVSEADTDGDGTPDCVDECPADPAKVAPGQCGCDVSDEDEDTDGVPDCLDACPNTYPWVSVDAKGCPPSGIQDFELFVNCFSGPAIPYGEGCAGWDLDVDGDVDQSDFGILQLRFVPRRPPGVLSVAEPDGFVGVGDQGGPFAPASKTYTLSNIGGRPITWTAEKTQAWVTLSRASGKLAAGASDILEIRVNAEASRLAAGSYSDTLTMANTTNARGSTTRAVNLTVNVRVIPPGMVLVPAGEFTYQNGPPIYLATFFIDQHEVTNASYCEFLNDIDKMGVHYYPGMKIDQTGPKGSYSYTVKAGKANYPIQWVTYDDATAFAAWRSQAEGRTYRLPTEQEWEKAAGWDPEEQKLYMYGFHQDVINCLWCNYHPEGAGACVGGPTPVGYYNGTSGRNDAKSYYGCYDMSGNVLEWTDSWYTVDQLRVIRGGSWEYAAMFCTVADRNNTSPAWRSITSGFRLVLPAE